MNGREPFPELTLRPFGHADLEGTVATFKRLSRQSLYRRFFTLMPDPSPFVARHLERVDHRDHQALVVLDRHQVVAVAQWDRVPQSPEHAELAMVVDEAWQHRGLGTALARAAAGDARRHGVTALTASVLAENRPAMRLVLRHHPTTAEADGGQRTYRFALDKPAA